VQASILFLAIRDFATLAQAEQVRQRARLVETVRALLPHWRDDTRVVLEADDGAAIVSLTGAVRVLEAATDPAARTGFGVALHHGAVRAMELAGSLQLVGDGLDTARSIATRPGKHPPMATRQFRRALLAAAPERRESLREAGDFVDERLRAHELYVLEPEAAQRKQRRRLLLGGAIVTSLLAFGGGLRFLRKQREEERRRADAARRAAPPARKPPGAAR
jgi:hypothetical protein